MTWYNISAMFAVQADEEKAEAISEFLATLVTDQLEAELHYVSVLIDKDPPDVPEPEPERPDAQVIPFRRRAEQQVGDPAVTSGDQEGPE